jgi:alkylation response protein AidB-like acyl-CoA dehydrogenase
MLAEEDTTEATGALRAWRLEVRSWLQAHVPRDLPALDGEVDSSGYRAWERELADAGYAAVHWPVEHGGRSADELERLVFLEEYERAEGPPRINIQGLMLAGPTLMAFGTPDQQRRWLGPMLRSEQIWCQGFSEPNAGSDLAALRTKAVQRGDELVVNGQKIWTTGAQYSDWIFVLVRTGSDGPKHHGITWLMVDLRTPGVEVRPIVQLDGRTEFAEVFFDDARVPVDNVVGGIGDGWRIAMTALGFERGVGRRSYVQYLKRLDQLRALLAGGPHDPRLAAEFGDVLAQVLMYRDYAGRVAAETRAGSGAATSAYNKLLWSELQVRLFQLGEHVLRATGERGDGRGGEWAAEYWYSRAARIFAGTNEIQKNVIAERVLGMPR